MVITFKYRICFTVLLLEVMIMIRRAMGGLRSIILAAFVGLTVASCVEPEPYECPPAGDLVEHETFVYGSFDDVMYTTESGMYAPGDRIPEGETVSRLHIDSRLFGDYMDGQRLFFDVDLQGKDVSLVWVPHGEMMYLGARQRQETSTLEAIGGVQRSVETTICTTESALRYDNSPAGFGFPNTAGTE